MVDEDAPSGARSAAALSRVHRVLCVSASSADTRRCVRRLTRGRRVSFPVERSRQTPSQAAPAPAVSGDQPHPSTRSRPGACHQTSSQERQSGSDLSGAAHSSCPRSKTSQGSEARHEGDGPVGPGLQILPRRGQTQLGVGEQVGKLLGTGGWVGGITGPSEDQRGL